jgi:small-conductance mechanosensitive channel
MTTRQHAQRFKVGDLVGVNLAELRPAQRPTYAGQVGTVMMVTARLTLVNFDGAPNGYFADYELLKVQL